MRSSGKCGLVLGGIGLFSLVFLLARLELYEPKVHAPDEAAGKTSALIVSGLVLGETSLEGDFWKVRIGEARFKPGRIGMLRVRVLDAIELRDVRVSRNGELLKAFEDLTVGVTGFRAAEPTTSIPEGMWERLRPLGPMLTLGG